MNELVENGTINRSSTENRHAEVAARALDQYCLGGASLTLLSDARNTVFRVDVPRQASFDRHPYLGRIVGRRFVLRVSNGEEHAAITRSELVWLAALLRDTGLTVPEPVPTRYGSLLAASTSLDEAESSQCVLLRWVEGRFLNTGLETSTLLMVGRYMAELHQHSEGFQPPVGFIRPRWDAHKLFGTESALQASHRARFFSHNDLALFREVAERIAGTMEQLGESRDVFGLIHADLHQGNYLLHGGEVRSIDFAGCGWGYYLFDIATTLSELRHRPDYPALRDAFLQGYRQLRPFSAEHEALISLFMIARRIDLVNGILSWEDPLLKPWVPRFLEKSVQALKRDE